jgi:uncharacterized protein (DUF2147 family)
MHTLKRSCLPAILTVLLVSPALAADPIGEWLVADGTARIRIGPCADALWGVISWANQPGTDENNPDPAKRKRSIIGLPILLHMKLAEANRWEGEVYNAENGKIYNSRIFLVKNDVLRIEGCLFAGFLCGGENWTRFTPAPGSAEAAAAAKPSAKPLQLCPTP